MVVESNNRTSLKWPTRAFLAVSVFCLACLASGAEQMNQIIPFKIEQISGSRPVVGIVVNGHPYQAFIHANAGLYLQINHAQAKTVRVKGMAHKDSFGIEAPGKVSALGRDTGVVERLQLGTVVDHDVPVSVFEKPADLCMLGLAWIRAHALILDFPHHQAVIPASAETAGALRARLLAEGYSAHPMTRDKRDGRYLVTVTVGNTSALMVVSSVADVTLDTEFARRAGVAHGPASGHYGGPSGATGNVYETRDQVVFSIGD
jgi:hypothetical protein